MGSYYFPKAVVARSVIILLSTNAARTTVRPTAEYIIVFFAPSNASGFPELVMYLKPPQTKKPTAVTPAIETKT